MSSNDSQKLRNCPFCGGEGKLKVADGILDDFTMFYCYCPNGKCIAGGTDWFRSREEAIEAWNTRAERTCMDVNEAWSDFGANVFSDDALDDFDKFEKVYQICQEIVEPLEFTCWIERTEQDEFGSYDYLSCGHIAMRQWPEKTRYCPSCGAKVVEE